MVSLTAMRPSKLLELHHARIREICLNHRVQDVRVFGSVLHRDDTETSDLDLLVEPTPQTTLLDIGAIRFELKELLGVEVEPSLAKPEGDKKFQFERHGYFVADRKETRLDAVFSIRSLA